MPWIKPLLKITGNGMHHLLHTNYIWKLIYLYKGYLMHLTKVFSYDFLFYFFTISDN